MQVDPELFEGPSLVTAVMVSMAPRQPVDPLTDLAEV